MYNDIVTAKEKITNNPYSTTFVLGNTFFDIFCDGTFLKNSVIKKYTNDLVGNKTKIFHNHFYNEIIFVEKGHISLETETEKIELTQNSLVYVPKNLLHLLRFEPNCIYYAIGFTFQKIPTKDKFLDSYNKFQQFFNDNIFNQELNNENVFIKLINKIQDYLTKPKTFSYLIIQTLLQEFILNLYELFAKNIDLTTTNAQIVSDFNFALNQKINNLHDHSKLKDIAQELFISERQLSRIIKKQYGVSFIERKHQLRIESAKQLLKNTDLSIEKISERVAFYDTTTFKKQFLKRVGVTPTQYRESTTPPHTKLNNNKK